MAESKNTVQVSIGQQFGRLTVTQRRTGEHHLWECLCSCGKTTFRSTYALRRTKTPSCGCYTRDRIIAISTTHGLSSTSEYKIWAGILKRCTNPKAQKFKHYGGRGIRVCDRWSSFENFYADMGPRPSSKHMIERINNEDHYSPENCKWTTINEQANNRRNNHKVTFRGKTQTLAQWSRELGLLYPTLVSRINESGWSVEKALTTPTGADR